MDNSLILPLAVIGVAFIVFSATIGVVYLSGSQALSPPAPPNLAPLESPTLYAAGDLVQSDDASRVVIVTGYNASHEFYSYQQVTANFVTGEIRIMEGTSTMTCQEFEIHYPHKVFVNT